MGGRCRRVCAGHPWRWGRRKGGALDRERGDTNCFFGTHRINSERGNDAKISLVRRVVGVGGVGVGVGGVGEDSVEVFEGLELSRANLLCHVAFQPG